MNAFVLIVVFSIYVMLVLLHNRREPKRLGVCAVPGCAGELEFEIVFNGSVYKTCLRCQNNANHVAYLTTA